MGQIRTDLAMERTAGLPPQAGLTETKRGEVFAVTEIEIQDDRYGKTLGQRKGKYITLEGENLGRAAPEFEKMAEELAEELRQLLPEGNAPVLVVGLGNRDITPDALGPKAAEQVLATRHLREEIGDEDPFLSSLRPVSVIAPGVLGQTGMEAAELTQALSGRLRPGAVIAVDALACAELNRLGTTIQLSDAGIAPGSGVQNQRRELSKETLGVPVIAVGVPTVVDLHTVAEALSGKRPEPGLPNLMVTPRNIDRLTANGARLVACGINLALHPQLDLETAESLTGL